LRLARYNQYVLAIAGTLLVILLLGLAGDMARRWLRDASGRSGRPLAGDAVRYVATSRHDLKVVDHAVFDPPLAALGGALARIDDRRILLVAGDGQILILSPGPASLGVLRPGLHLPMNRGDYVAGVDNATPWFRVTGALLEENASGPRRLYVAHHHWDVARRCVTLRLSETMLDVNRLPARLEWATRYDTRPCIPGEKLPNTSGGRLAFLDAGRILMTVGDHAAPYGAEPHSSHGGDYGSIIALDRSDWSVRTFTAGHRNPQGLLVTDGAIWSTEHGPQGGDELNRLVEGAQYGWPRATYGTDYGRKSWQLIDAEDVHASGTRPVYAWVPSIAVSNLIRIRGRAFPAWQSNLVAGSLSGAGNGSSVFRIVLDDARVVLVERIHVRRPVRDLIEHSDGRLVLWDGSGTIQTLEPATHVFAACSGCHAIRRAAHGIGPDLMGVVGARIARHADYPYSETLRAVGGRWTPGRLEEFLRDPAEFAPGTTMQFAGIEDAVQRATLIEYLQDLDDRE
jgi:cytochrome c2